MTTLSDILQTVSMDLGITDSFYATGGTATTTVNTSFGNESEPPDEERFKNNYLFVRRDAGGAGADPEGKWALISAYAPATYTITHATFTTAPASGDEMLLVKQNNFPILEMIAAVNRALMKLGVHEFTDITSITIADGQTEYSLPAGVTELIDVLIQRNDDSNDNDWKVIPGCKIIMSTSAMSSEPVLYIPQQSTGYDIMLKYRGYHPVVSAYNSVIHKFIPKDLLIAATKMTLLESYINSKSGSAKEHWGRMYQEALRQFNEGRIMLPVQRLNKKQKRGLLWPAFDSDTSINVETV